MLSLGQLYTDNTNDNANDDDDDTNNTQWTNHDCIGSLACMPNEPKSPLAPYCDYYNWPLNYVYFPYEISSWEN